MVGLVVFSGGIEQVHVVRLRWHAAQVTYGPKGGYFVTLPPGSEATGFLRRGAPALDYLSRCHHVTLDLGQTRVSDSDLRFLERVRGAISVSIENTAVTDAGLQSFYRMPGLSGVDVSNPHVSDEAMAALCRAKEWRKAE